MTTQQQLLFELNKTAKQHYNCQPFTSSSNWLCRINEKYVILSQPGHKDHIICTFEDVPYVCPCPYSYSINNEEEEEKWYEVKENFDLDTRWTEEAERFSSSFKVCPEVEHEIICDCELEHKYNREKHGYFNYWLFDFCGKLIEKYFLNNLLEPWR